MLETAKVVSEAADESLNQAAKVADETKAAAMDLNLEKVAQADTEMAAITEEISEILEDVKEQEPEAEAYQPPDDTGAASPT